jgi:pyrroline-5-carboxylate reductase
VATTSITFIGAGNMASSIIGGLVAKGFDAQSITASDPFQQSLDRLREIAPVNITSDNDSAIDGADIVVLAVKPQIMKDVAAAITPAIQRNKPLIISIAAGIEMQSLDQWLGGDLAIVRCMPNTPALVQTGATGLFANSAVSDNQRQLASDILQAIGLAIWVDSEAKLDAVTAVSGSGPAYFFLLMEAMQAAGEQLGLSVEEAKQLTLQTALGAAKMALGSDVDAAELRRRVTSPNGTTEAAINSMQGDGFETLVNKALSAAHQRSQQLAKELA